MVTNETASSLDFTITMGDMTDLETFTDSKGAFDLDFLIEIHPEDGFLGGEIRFRICGCIGTSRFRFI